MKIGEFDQVEVLLVEDNPADAVLALRALGKHHFANRVCWVKDGAEALDYLVCAGAYMRTVRQPTGRS